MIREIIQKILTIPKYRMFKTEIHFQNIVNNNTGMLTITTN